MCPTGQLSIGIPRRECAGVGFVLASGAIEAVRLLFQLGLVPRDLLLVRSEFGRRTPGDQDCSRRQQGEMNGFHVITIILFLVLFFLLVLQRALKRNLPCRVTGWRWGRQAPA